LSGDHCADLASDCIPASEFAQKHRRPGRGVRWRSTWERSSSPTYALSAPASATTKARDRQHPLGRGKTVFTSRRTRTGSITTATAAGTPADDRGDLDIRLPNHSPRRSLAEDGFLVGQPVTVKLVFAGHDRLDRRSVLTLVNAALNCRHASTRSSGSPLTCPVREQWRRRRGGLTAGSCSATPCRRPLVTTHDTHKPVTRGSTSVDRYGPRFNDARGAAAVAIYGGSCTTAILRQRVRRPYRGRLLDDLSTARLFFDTSIVTDGFNLDLRNAP